MHHTLCTLYTTVTLFGECESLFQMMLGIEFFYNSLSLDIFKLVFHRLQCSGNLLCFKH